MLLNSDGGFKVFIDWVLVYSEVQQAVKYIENVEAVNEFIIYFLLTDKKKYLLEMRKEIQCQHLHQIVWQIYL